MNVFTELNKHTVGDIFRFDWDESSVDQGLSVNVGNRNIRPVYLHKYESDMISGRWEINNGANIKFYKKDGNWRLADGQHELTAMKNSKKFHPRHIAIVSENAMRGAIDCGAGRTDRDNYKISGIDIGVKNYPAEIPSTAAAIWDGPSNKNHLSRSAKIALVVATSDAIKFVHDEALLIKLKTINVGSVRGVFGRSFYGYKSYETIMDQAEYKRGIIEAGEILITGIQPERFGKEPCSMLKLRDFLFNNKGKSQSNANRKEVYMKTIYALDHHLRDKEMKNLVKAKNDPFKLPSHVVEAILCEE